MTQTLYLNFTFMSQRDWYYPFYNNYTPVMSISPESSVKKITDSLSCDKCNFDDVSDVALKIYKSQKHGDIPQIDGDCSIVRNTNCWWEKHPYKSFYSQNRLLKIPGYGSPKLCQTCNIFESYTPETHPL